MVSANSDFRSVNVNRWQIDDASARRRRAKLPGRIRARAALPDSTPWPTRS